MLYFNNRYHIHNVENSITISTINNKKIEGFVSYIDKIPYFFTKEAFDTTRFNTESGGTLDYGPNHNIIASLHDKNDNELLTECIYKHEINSNNIYCLNLKNINIDSNLFNLITEYNGKIINNNIDFEIVSNNYETGTLSVDRNNLKPGRFLKKYTNLNDRDIEIVSLRLKFNPADTYHSTLKGYDIYEAYKSSNSNIIEQFTLYSSCFKDKPKEFYDLFALNDCFSLFVIKETKTDKVLSRCILYSTSHGIYHDDYIYSSSKAVDIHMRKTLESLNIPKFSTCPNDFIIKLEFPFVSKYKNRPGYLDTPLLEIEGDMFNIRKRN